MGSDASFVALDDITAHLEDLDSLDMGNVQGRDSGRFVRSKRKSKRRYEEKSDYRVEDVDEKADEETGEETRYVSCWIFYFYTNFPIANPGFTDTIIPNAVDTREKIYSMLYTVYKKGVIKNFYTLNRIFIHFHCFIANYV